MKLLDDKVIALRESLIETGAKMPIYCDYQATTPLDPRILDEMLPYFTEKFGNPHSRTHSFGWEAEEAVETARTRIAGLIGAEPKEIVFTSGATEANNLAIKGIVNFHRSNTKDHIVTLTTEHKCVLDTCRQLERSGIRVTYLPVQTNGIVDLNLLRDVITERTILVSVMAVNNEIGILQPLEAIGKICREAGVYFHSDIAQGYGKIDINVNDCNLDLASISAHKIYGPKGIGALYVRKRPRVRLSHLISGGGQERGLRSGTIPTPLAVGFGSAALIAKQEMAAEYARIKELSETFYQQLHEQVTEVSLNGDRLLRYPGNMNLSFAYVEGESLILAIKDIALSSGSACTSTSLESSYVLKALGIRDDLAHTSLRFGFGRFTTLAEVEYAAALVAQKTAKLRDLSPLWEMVQAGINLQEVKWTEH